MLAYIQHIGLQWGYNSGISELSAYTVTFPIVYSSAVYNVIPILRTGSSELSCSTTDYSLSTFILRPGVLNPNSGHAFGWVSIGVQQWGTLSTANRKNFVTDVFNISFSSICFSVITKVYGVTGDDDCTYGDICVKNWDLNSVVTKNGRNSTLSGIYIAIGIQQWGDFVSNLNLEHTHSFPLSASNCVASFWVLKDTNTFAMYRFIGWNGSTLSFAEHRYTNNHYMTNCTLFVVCIQQWGQSYTKTTITYPIAFTSFMSVTLSHNSTAPGFTSHPYSAVNYTTTSFLIASESSPGTGGGRIVWIAIGI